MSLTLLFTLALQVPTPAVPGRRGSANSRPIESRTSRKHATPKPSPRQSRRSTLAPGPQTKAQASNSGDSIDSHAGNSKDTTISALTRPRTATCSVAVSIVTPADAEPAPKKGTPPNPSTSEASSRRSGNRGMKKVFHVSNLWR